MRELPPTVTDPRERERIGQRDWETTGAQEVRTMREKQAVKREAARKQAERKAEHERLKKEAEERDAKAKEGGGGDGGVGKGGGAGEPKK